MKTPRSNLASAPKITFKAKSCPPPCEQPPTPYESRIIVRGIAGVFEEYASRYDTKKYWPEIYQQSLDVFQHPLQATQKDIRIALWWKFGHLGKRRVPDGHKKLVRQIARTWKNTVADLPRNNANAFAQLDNAFGGPNRFITVSFLLHLIRPKSAPIIDQHNYRGVNHLIAQVRSEWKYKKTPSNFEDVRLVHRFLTNIIKAWRDGGPSPTRSRRELDKFLMMYGKAIKSTKPTATKCS